jgi:predicted nucleotidyltransferase
MIPAMDRDQTLALLRRHKPELARRFGVLRLALFGSVARDHARPDSDADVLVAFDGPADSKRYFGLQFYLEDLLGRPVDLVTEAALRPQLRPFIERDALSV